MVNRFSVYRCEHVAGAMNQVIAFSTSNATSPAPGVKASASGRRRSFFRKFSSIWYSAKSGKLLFCRKSKHW